MGRAKRFLDSPILTRVRTAQWLGLSLAALGTLLLGLVAGTVAVLLNFPLYAQILCGIGALGLVVSVVPQAIHWARGRRTLAEAPVREALHAVDTEIATIARRVDRALDEGWFFPGFDLPTRSMRSTPISFPSMA